MLMISTHAEGTARGHSVSHRLKTPFQQPALLWLALVLLAFFSKGRCKEPTLIPCKNGRVRLLLGQLADQLTGDPR